MSYDGFISAYVPNKGYGYIQEDNQGESGIYIQKTQIKKPLWIQNAVFSSIDLKGARVRYYNKPYNADKKCYEALDINLYQTPGDLIFIWSSFEDYGKIISDLQGLSLKEDWDLFQTANGSLNILSNYFRYTFYRLAIEEKIVSQRKYAAFNTGLVDRRYIYIYALFERIHSEAPHLKPPWQFKSFCFEGEDEGKILTQYFNPMPAVAQYFKNPADRFYDFIKEPSYDWDHILLDSISRGRYPIFFLEENSHRDYKFPNFAQMKAEEKKIFFKQYAEMVKNDVKLYRRFMVALEDAFKMTWNRLKWNYKTAIPQYYAPRDEISFLLPVSLGSGDDSETVHIALVVAKTISGNYQAHTILTLAHAYSNARLVCRPLSDWLELNRIKDDSLIYETTDDQIAEGNETDSTETKTEEGEEGKETRVETST